MSLEQYVTCTVLYHMQTVQMHVKRIFRCVFSHPLSAVVQLQCGRSQELVFIRTLKLNEEISTECRIPVCCQFICHVFYVCCLINKNNVKVTSSFLSYALYNAVFSPLKSILWTLWQNWSFITSLNLILWDKSSLWKLFIYLPLKGLKKSSPSFCAALCSHLVPHLI